MILREERRQKVDVIKTERQASELLFAGLPVAAFRTDKRLRVIKAFGSLWDDLKVDASSIQGADLSNPQCHLVPPFLHQIDSRHLISQSGPRRGPSVSLSPIEGNLPPFLLFRNAP